MKGSCIRYRPIGLFTRDGLYPSRPRPRTYAWEKKKALQIFLSVAAFLLGANRLAELMLIKNRVLNLWELTVAGIGGFCKGYRTKEVHS